MKSCDIKTTFNNWVPLSDEDIEMEYNTEYKNHTIRTHGDIFPTIESFKKAVKKAQQNPVKITKEEDKGIGNRSRCKDIDCIIDLIKTYRSYPMYRNEKTVMQIDEGFKKNKPMKMPIILKFKDGNEMRVMSGNTRMDIAFINCIEPLVIIIPVGTIAYSLL